MSHLYGEVSIFGCNIFRNKEEYYLPIIFLAEYDESKIVYDHNGKEVIRIDEGENIEIQKAFISVDGVIYGNEKEELVNLCGAELLRSVRNYNGEVRTYHTREGNYVILYFDDWNVDFEEIEAKNAIGLSEKFIDWQYDFENNQFKYVPEDDPYDYNDYPDDTDYDRETYYALGGDDYDAFKERGGSIDDMMDGMGY